jgi:hypothetical protein
VDPSVSEQPSKEAFDMPSPTVAAQWSTVLSLVRVRRVMRSDELDATFAEALVELVAVVCGVADQSSRQRFGEARLDRFLDEDRLISRTTRNPCGDRKTSAV